MAKVDINIIKEWFRNLKKPNQEQFWSWLDSFRHKDDKIPMADVENLNQTLTKKADLVNGVVPENQLPFTINSNEVISIGEITTTTNSVTVGVHSSGSNKVRINGQILTRNFSNTLPFTPVTDGKKFLRVVAKNATGLFFLKESAESDEPQEPALDAGEVHVRLILVTPDGTFIDPEVLNGFKEKAEDNWKTVMVSLGVDSVIYFDDARSRFRIKDFYPSGIEPVGAVYRIKGIKVPSSTRDYEFIIYNDTQGEVSFLAAQTGDFGAFKSNYTVANQTYALVKYDSANNILEVLKVGGTGGLANVTTDTTLQGTGSESDPLGLSDSKNAEITGKISKQGINLGDTGNIPEMKTGDISGIYRGNPASNPVYDFSPFIQMTTADTFAQLHFNYVNGEMAYRAGNIANGYSPIRISWDTGNLVNPATQTWVNQYFLGADTAIAAGFVNGNKEIPYIRHSDMTIVGLATTNWVTTQTAPATQAEVEASTGTESNPTFSEPATENRKFLTLFNFFKLIKKLRYIHLLPNSGPAVANRLWSDGTDVYYDDNLAIPNKLAKDKQIYKIISGDVTLDNSYHNAIVRITATCTITVPANLRSDFNCVFDSFDAAIATFVEGSGTTFSFPYGKILKSNSMGTVYKYKGSTYRLNGGFTNIA